MKEPIFLTDEIRQEIESARSAILGQRAAFNLQRATIASEISALEKIEVELVARSEALRPQVVRSDEATRSFNEANIRLEAVCKELSDWRGKLESLTTPTLWPARVALIMIACHWREQLENILDERLADFGQSNNSTRHIFSNTQAFYETLPIENFPAERRSDEEAVKDVFNIFDNALSGKWDLRSQPDAPVEQTGEPATTA